MTLRTGFLLVIFSVIYSAVCSGQSPIAASEDTVFFRSVRVGFSRDASIELRNMVDADVEILGLTITPDIAVAGEFSVVTPQPTNFMIARNETRFVLLRFRPQLAGNRYATLNILTATDTLRVGLVGEVTSRQPDVVIEPRFIDFGTHQIGVVKDTTFLLMGGGVDTAFIYDFLVTNNDGDIYFQVYPKNSTITFPRDLAPNDTIEMIAEFTAKTPFGVKTGSTLPFGDLTGDPYCEFRADIAKPEADFTDNPIDLGIIKLGSSIDSVAYVTSIGELPVTINSFLPTVIFQTTPPGTPLDLPVGDSIPISIHFDGSTVGKFEEELAVAYHETVDDVLMRYTLIRALVLPDGLASTNPLTDTIPCGRAMDYVQEITLYDSGDYDFSITNISLSNSSFSFIAAPVYPYVIKSKSSNSLEIVYHHTAGKTQPDTCIIDYRMDEYTVHRDTVIYVPRSEEIPFNIDLTSAGSGTMKGKMKLQFDGALNSYSVDTVILTIRLENTDVAQIEPTAIASQYLTAVILEQGVRPNGDMYVIWCFTDQLSFTGSTTILEIPIQYFIARESSTGAILTLEAIGLDGCVTFAADSISLSAPEGCGDEYLRRQLRGESLLPTIVFPTITAKRVQPLIISAADGQYFSIEIIDVLGAVVFRDISRETQRYTDVIDMRRFASGAYFLRVAARDRYGRRQTVTKRFLIE